MRGRGMALACLLVLMAAAGGDVGAESHHVPPVSGLRPAAPPAAGLAAEGPTAPSPLGWRTFLAYRQALRWTGGAVLASTLALVLAHFAFYGAHHVRPTGRMVRRYGAREIVLHALLALAFLGAWASSTYLLLAKHVLGYAEAELAVPLGRASSTVHVVAGLLFFASLLALGVIWWRAMRFAPYDAAWFRALGGYFSRRHPILPAGHFNAGQKAWFRVALLLGVLVTLSGALLYYPALLGVPAAVALFIGHTALGVLLSAAVLVHVYLAVVVHPRAMRAIFLGTVDEACLREDHPLAVTGPEPRTEAARRRERSSPSG